MKKKLLRFWLYSLLVGLSTTLQAQTLDPSLAITSLYQPVNITSAIEQSDGKHVIVGWFTKAEGVTVGGLVRYNVNHTPDQAFNGNVAGIRGAVTTVRQLPSGKLLLIGPDSIRLGRTGRRNLLCLNTDGTPDASFNAGSGTTVSLQTLVTAVQADGKILVGGEFQSFSGTVANRLLRLLPDGTPDAGFTCGAALNGAVKDITLQPDGKILIGGAFSTPRRIARLLPGGAVDNTFASPLTSANGTSGGIELVGLQPDGKIIIAGRLMNVGTGVIRVIARLLPGGALDNTFQTPPTTDYYPSPTNYYDSNEIAVLADGRVVISGFRSVRYNGVETNGLFCLESNGAVSQTLNNIFIPDEASGLITSLVHQRNGQWLVASSGKLLTGQRSYVTLLNANGTWDATFQPNLVGMGFINSVAQQADGRLLIAGDFDEVNGVRAKSLARLNLDGSVDAAFSNQGSLRYAITQVAVTLSGKVLISSNYDRGLERLTNSGSPDASFVASTMTAGSQGVSHFLQQPDGRILIITQGIYIQRLLPDGQFDTSFAPYNGSGFRSIALQADGKIVVGGNLESDQQTGLPTRNVIRLLPNGQRDTGFTELVASSNLFMQSATLQSTGKIIVCASAARIGVNQLLRLLPDGQPDASFTPMVARYTNDGFTAVQVQADDRIMASTSNYNSPGNFSEIRRFTADGQPDNTFTPVVCGGYANTLLTQADGKIVSAGNFLSVNGTPQMGLVRIIPGSVLAPHNASIVSPQLAVWPSPAHGELQVATSQVAKALTLLNLQGQVVQRQVQPVVNATLDVRHLPAGVYLLRVDYAAGPVTRRVVIE